jgi:hypothetical protein
MVPTVLMPEGPVRPQPIFNPLSGLSIPVPFFREFHSRLFTAKPFRLKIAGPIFIILSIQIHFLLSARKLSVSPNLQSKKMCPNRKLL